MSRIYRQDLTGPITEQLTEADCIYSNPPSCLSRLTIAYNQAGKDCPYEMYEQFLDDFFRYIDAIQPDVLYIRVTASNRAAILAGCKARFSHVDVDLAYEQYRKRHRCWIIRCGKDGHAPAPERQVDVKTYIRWLCREVDFEQMADIWMADTTAGFNCHKLGKKFSGTAISQSVIDKLTAKINAWELKQDKRQAKKKNPAYCK